MHLLRLAKRKRQQGFTLVELMIVIAMVLIVGLIIAGFVAFFVIGGKAIPYANSQSVTDIAAIEWVESHEEGYRDVKLVESYRVDPQAALGCTPAQNAGFHLTAVDSDNETVDLKICCLGSPGHDPRCDLAD